EQSRDWYNRAIGEGTKYPIAYLHLANAFTALKDWKSAERAYLDGIAEHPKEASLYWNLGSWYEARGRIADAEKVYRKGCDLPDEVEGSPRSSLQMGDVAQCYQSLAYLLGGRRVGRPAESVQVLQRGIARLEKGLGGTNGDRSQKELLESLDIHLSRLIELLGERYIFDGRRDDAVSLIHAELKKRPTTFFQARALVNLCNRLGMQQAALELARLAESTIHQQPSAASLQPARGLVDTQLWQMGLFNELLGRLETRRALGEEMGAT